MTRSGFLKSLMAGTVVGIPAVKSVEVLALKPEDILVLTCAGSISNETAVRLKEVLTRELPGQKCLVMGDGLELKVIRK